jgi:hypothetical protein
MTLNHKFVLEHYKAQAELANELNDLLDFKNEATEALSAAHDLLMLWPDNGEVPRDQLREAIKRCRTLILGR